MNDAQKYLLNSGCDDLILNDRKCTKVEDRLYASDMMMEFARSYHEKLSKLHQGAVISSVCIACSGSGKLLISDCDWCKGTGKKQTDL
jgi:RecJ-like exonuclease